jgi:hypothetical protein
VEIQELALGGPHAPAGSPPGTLQTNVFQIALSPDGRTLYAISQSTNPTGNFADGNQLHILSVAADGRLSEPNGPVLLSTAGVPGDAHPQGIAVVVEREHAQYFVGGEQRRDEGRKGIDPFGMDVEAIQSSSIPHSSGSIADVFDLDVASLGLLIAHSNRQSGWAS